RFGSASPGASYLQIAAVALADMAQLCGELSVYRPRLDQSPPSHALCGRLWLSLLHREIAHVLRQRLTRKIGVQHPDLVAQVILQRVRCLAVFKIRPLQGKSFPRSNGQVASIGRRFALGVGIALSLLNCPAAAQRPMRVQLIFYPYQGVEVEPEKVLAR